MSVKKFGGGVHDHVRPKLNRALEVRRHESIVNHNINPVSVADFTNCAQVAKLHQRVSRRLQKYQPCVLLQLQRPLNIVDVRCIDVRECQPKINQHLIEQARSPTVKVVTGDDVISRFEHGNDGVDGGHSAAKHCATRFRLRARRGWSPAGHVSDSIPANIRSLCACRSLPGRKWTKRKWGR